MIEIVSRPGCRYCDEAKAWMRREGIDYREVRDSSGGSVPRLRKDGVELMTGWNQDAWRQRLRTRGGDGMMRSMVPSGGVPPMPSGSITDSVREFFETPAPPSELHRFGVTAAGAVASNLVVTKALPGKVSPNVEMIAGVATILAGHFVAKRWEAKSVGYGMLADGVYRRFVQPRLAAATDARQGVVGDQAIIGGVMNQGTQRVLSEAEYLAAVEGGAEDQAPSGSAAAPYRPPFRGAVMPTHIRMADGSLLTVGEYNQRYIDRLEAAAARGRQRRASREGVAGSVNAMPEVTYLARLRDEARANAVRGTYEAPRAPNPTHIGQIESYEGVLPLERYRVLFSHRVLQAGQEGAAQGAADRQARSNDADAGGGASTGGGGASTGGGSNPLRDMARGQTTPGPLFELTGERADPGALMPSQTMQGEALGTRLLMPQSATSMQGVLTGAGAKQGLRIPGAGRVGPYRVR